MQVTFDLDKSEKELLQGILDDLFRLNYGFLDDLGVDLSDEEPDLSFVDEQAREDAQKTLREIDLLYKLREAIKA